MAKFKTNFTACICVLALFAGLVGPQLIQAKQINNQQKQGNGSLPAEIETGLSYLLELIHKKGSKFDPAKILPLLDLVAQGGDDTEQPKPSTRESGNGACLRAQVKAPLERILRYEYNHRIPTFLVSPNALRLSNWYPESDIVTNKVELWNEFSTLNKPLLLWGKQFEVNTPDLFSGSYYRYDLNRLIIIMKHNGKKVMISASKMPNPSEAGKKALIIDEKNWNYFYSGIQGLGIRLMGMLNTYIYDSASIKILYETDSTKPQTTIMLFKWLKAGWADINMVKRSHIYDGSVRFVEGLKEVIESDSLPAADALEQKLKHISALPEAKIDNKIREYSINFERIAKKHEGMSKKDYARIIADGGYANVLNIGERRGILALEWLKSQLGKSTLAEFDFPSPLPQKTLAETGAEIPVGKADSM
jgi:hypothetical protein